MFKNCYAKLCRYGDLDFKNNYRTSYESQKIQGLGATVGGYLVWRRTLIMPCTVLLSMACVIQCVLTGATYFQGYRNFIKRFVGEAIWTNVFCPDDTKPCKAADGFIGVYYVLMVSDLILCLVAAIACMLLVRATRSWSHFNTTAKMLRRAYGALFGAPFILLLILAPAQFVNVGQTQQLLCAERAGDLLPPGIAVTKAQINELCAEDIDQWATSLNQTLAASGRLRDPKSGSCSFVQAETKKASAAFAASGAACEDVPAATFTAASATLPVKDCAQAASLGLCTFSDPKVSSTIQSSCPLACGLCSVTAECYDNDAKFAEFGNPNGVTTCAAALAAGWCTHSKASVRTTVRRTCPVSCNECSAECVDRDEAFDLQGNPGGLTSCAGALAYGPNGDVNLCTATDRPSLRSITRTVCVASCGLCPSGRRRLLELSRLYRGDEMTGRDGEAVEEGAVGRLPADDAAAAALPPRHHRSRALQASSLKTAFDAGGVSGSERLKLDGCVDPLVVTAVGALEVTLSDEVIIGAIALRRSASVLATLLPAAIGLGMGAGAGATQAKTLLTQSRQPARLANIIVVTSIIFVTAILGIVNQLLASGWGTLSTLCIICTLAVWLPFGLGAAHVKPLSAVGASIVHPAPSESVVAAVGRRKHVATLLMLMAALFLGCFLGLSSAVSMVTQQLVETQKQLHASVRAGSNQGNWGPFLFLLLSICQTLFEVIAKTYLAQAFYTDSGVIAVTLMWHNDRADTAEVAEKRADELAEVAHALGRDQSKRQITERPRARPPRGGEGGPDEPDLDHSAQMAVAVDVPQQMSSAV